MGNTILDGIYLPSEYHWRADYGDGSSLNQINVDGSENKYSDIDRGNLIKFTLLDDDDQPHVVVPLTRSQKLIFRRRNMINLIHSGPEVTDTEMQRDHLWIVGWQENREGLNVQSIIFLFRDGHVEVRDRFDEAAPYNSFVFTKDELV